MAYSVRQLKSLNHGEVWFCGVDITSVTTDPTASGSWGPNTTPAGWEAWDLVSEYKVLNLNTISRGSSYAVILSGGAYLYAGKAANGALTVESHTSGSGGTFTVLTPLDEDDYYWAILANDGLQKAQLAVVQHYMRDSKTYVSSQPVGTYEHELWLAIKDILPVPDPYKPAGTSTTSGHEAAGNFDDTSDTISIPTIPSLNLSLNHFLSAYVPTVGQLNDLADFVWGEYDKTDPTKLLSKILADPTDAIISLHMLPFTPASSTAIEVTIGKYGSSVSMPPLTAQFTDVDCGSLTISEYWGNYLDYNPFTRLTIFLPYVGEVDLNPDEVMGQTLGVTYRVDNLTGAFVCFLYTSDKILAQYNGCCALSVPVSSADYRQLNSAILGAAMSAVGAAAGFAGAGAGLAAGSAEGAIGGPNLAAGGISAAANVLQSKVHHSHSGGLGGAAGFLGSQTPYVIIHRARQCLPEFLNQFAGYPSMVTMRLGDLYGFTSVSSIILSGLPYTDGELSELAQILKEGFII